MPSADFQLLEATIKNDAVKVRHLLTCTKAKPGAFESAAIKAAVKHESVEIMRAFIESGAMGDRHLRDARAMAVEQRKQAIVAEMDRLSSATSVGGSNAEHAIIEAMRAGETERARALIDAQAGGDQTLHREVVAHALRANESNLLARMIARGFLDNADLHRLAKAAVAHGASECADMLAALHADRTEREAYTAMKLKSAEDRVHAADGRTGVMSQSEMTAAVLASLDARGFRGLPEWIDRGWDINGDHGAALTAAVNAGSTGAARQLLQLGADPNVNRGALLPMATRVGNFRMFSLLVKHGGDPLLSGNASLCDLASAGEVSRLRAYVDAFGGLETFQGLPLRTAIEHGHHRTAERLLVLGANPDANGGMPVRIAIRRGDVTMLQLLQGRRAKVSRSMIQSACASPHAAMKAWGDAEMEALRSSERAYDRLRREEKAAQSVADTNAKPASRYGNTAPVPDFGP